MAHFHNTALIGASGAGSDAFKINRSLRFNSDDSAYLNRTPSSAGNRRTFTYSVWVKRNNLGTRTALFGVGTAQNDSSYFAIEIESAGDLRVSGWNTLYAKTNDIFRDSAAWYHLVIAVDTTQSAAADQIKIYKNGTLVTKAVENAITQNTQLPINSTSAHNIGYQPQANQYGDKMFANIVFVDGQALAPTAFGEFDSNNVWQPKKYSGSYGTNGFRLDFSDNSSDQALGYDAAVDAPTVNPDGGFEAITYTGNGSTNNVTGLNFQPDFVWIKNRTDSTSHMLFDSVRGVKKVIYSNATTQEQPANISVTSYDPNGFTVGSANEVNGNNDNMIAWCWKAGGPAVSNSDGSITSQVSANTDYGFSIVSYTGTGSNATIGHGLSSAPKFILLKFTGSTSNWSVYHSAIGNTKRLVLNSTGSTSTSSTYWQNTSPTSSVFSVGSDVNDSTSIVAYCWSEVSGFSKFGSYTGTGSSGNKVTTGFKPRYVLVKRTTNISGSHMGWSIVDSARGSDKKLQAQSSAQENDGPINAASPNDDVTFQDDGFTLASGGSATNGNNETYIFAAFADRPGNNFDVNNLIAEAGFETANQGMDVVTYTGNGSARNIGGLAFAPDLVIVKSRNASYYHYVVDRVRGVNKNLYTNSTEATQTADRISSFNSDGFGLTSHTGVNNNGTTYVAWCWKAGGSASSNSNGSITSSVSANNTYGFSIVSYTGNGTAGATIGHGLSSAPKWIIVKDRDNAASWHIQHSAIGNTSAIFLNSDSASVSNSAYWNNTSPTSSVFSVGTADGMNGSGNDYIAYCWSEISGFSRFGSYTGTGSAHHVELGFKPRYLLYKCSSSGGTNWHVYDSARNNGRTRMLPNLTAGDSGPSADSYAPTFTNTGFTVAAVSDGHTNANGQTYIYAAFAGIPPGEIIDSLIDTPTNYEADSGNNGGNYCTLNPLDNATTLSDGNLTITGSGTAFKGVRSTIGMSSGKWYMECTIAAYSSPTSSAPGIWNGDDTSLNTGGGSYGNAYLFVTDYASNYRIYVNKGASNPYSESGSISAGDVIGIALDLDNGECYVHINGTYLNSGNSVYSTWPADTYFFGGYEYTSGNQLNFNFGQRAFTYTPPSGHKSLCTQNLPDPTIEEGSTAFDAKLYTGNGGTQSITGLGFSPDLIWLKDRSATNDHNLYDVVRGTNKKLVSNSTAAQVTVTNVLNSFDASGFSIGDSGQINANNNSYVGWAWDAGSSTSSNTDGSITSSVRANPSAGFSICTYTGNGTANSTVGHGLNAAPSLIIIKNRDQSPRSWMVLHTSAGLTGTTLDGSAEYKMLKLESTNAAADLTNDNIWNPTSTTFKINGAGTGNSVNYSGDDYVAYCWAPVAGFSAFGSYTGNGSAADGPFVYTGFRPKFLLWKRLDSAENWMILDSKRSTFNQMDDFLCPNTNAAEVSGPEAYMDFLSNGFKIKTNYGVTNAGTSATYIYAAFAEHPFKTARAR